MASILLILGTLASAQVSKPATTADSNSKRILILDNEWGEFIQNDTNAVHKLIGHVKLLHGTDTLYCDSAYFYTKRSSVEAFGNVWVRQLDGTEASADYMRYNGLTRVVFMKSIQPGAEVQLYDGQFNTLWSKEIEYNLNTKLGKFAKNGYLQTETTVLESNSGTYNLKSKEARFFGNVQVSDPEYQVVSEDLGYNTTSKIVTFFSPSTITNDKSIMQTFGGTYDAIQKIGLFTKRSNILNEAQYIEGDELHYNKNTGEGLAIGRVIAIDTGMKTTLYAGHALYNEINKTLLAYTNPIMKRKDGADSMYLRSDTFFSAPDTLRAIALSAQDSLQKTVDQLKAAVDTTQTDSITVNNNTLDTLSLKSNKNDKDSIDSKESVIEILEHKDSTKATATTDTLLPILTEIKHNKDTLTITEAVDTSRRMQLSKTSSFYNNVPTPADTSTPRYFIAYNHALIYSDSLQGKCDSMRYSQVDSLLRMYNNPLLWPKDGQLKGDEIFMQLDSNRLKTVYVRKNAIMINRSGPVKADMYDQIQGNDITGYLTNNSLDSLMAMPNAASIYFIKDEDSAYVGCSDATSNRIDVYFEKEEIERIVYRKDVEQKTTPMKDVEPSSLRLSRFKWHEEERPSSFEIFLNGINLPIDPDITGSLHPSPTYPLYEDPVLEQDTPTNSTSSTTVDKQNTPNTNKKASTVKKKKTKSK
jgi:lipopolysaccharide export system protein LptA